MTALAPHKAQWSEKQTKLVPALLADRLPPGSIVWDPCAGIGVGFHDVMGPTAGWVTVGSEIEPEWAGWRPADPALLNPDGWPSELLLQAIDAPCAVGTVCADSTTIPERLHGVFDGSVTSYVFDNRMNDRFVGESDYKPGTRRCKACSGTGFTTDAESCAECEGTGKVERPPAVKTFDTPTGPVVRPDRMNYAAMLGRAPSPGSAAGMRGRAWRNLTMRLLHAQIAAVRVGGTIAIELKDALEDNGERVRSVQWFLGYVCGGGLGNVRLDVVHAMPAPGDRRGQNHAARIAHSQLIVLTRTEGML